MVTTLEKKKDPMRWVDTSEVNTIAVMERYVSALTGVDARTHGGTYKRACHFPGTCAGQGDDRLQLYPHRQPWNTALRSEENKDRDAGPCFWCSVCNKSGNILQFIALSEGLDWEIAAERTQILEIAGLDPATIKHWDGQSVGAATQYQPTSRVSPPSAFWEKRAIAFCIAARDLLWEGSPEANQVLGWLQETRGLTRSAIRRAGLGYHPAWEKMVNEEWGITDEKSHAIAPGLIIPWLIDGRIWYVQVRLGDEELKRAKARAVKQGKRQPARYLPIAGGSLGLYGVNEIRDNQPLIMVESVLDKLVGSQETGPDIIWVATGSISYGHDPHWLREIGRATPVLIGYDFEENRAGDKAYRNFWKKQAMKPVRWQPWEKDISEMKKAGQDIALWASMGVRLAQGQDDEASPPATVPSSPNTVNTLNTVPQKAVTDRPEQASPIASVYGVSTLSTVSRGQHEETGGPEQLPPLSAVYEGDTVNTLNTLDTAPLLVATDAAIRCFGCQKQLVEAEYENAWQMTTDGLEFCNHCWTSRHIEHAAKALLWLIAHGMPTGLEARIAAFLASPGCALCGGREWIIDELTGALVCPCQEAKREAVAKLGQEQTLILIDAQVTQPLCTLCAAAGRFATGVETYEDMFERHFARRTPDRPFYYIWIEKEQCWICAGCQDVQKSLPALAETKNTAEEPVPPGALVLA